tara:strand:- start:927 stop:1487 length:561 start_codon:yes stop_codon:yes gene_type:complete
MEKHVASMVDTIDTLKEKISTQEYIDLYSSLMEINKFKPKEFKYIHRVDYELVTHICYIDDDEEFLKIKKENYYDSYEQYQQDDEEFNEDFERQKEITTEHYFMCHTSEIITDETHTMFESARIIGEAEKHTLDYYGNAYVMEDHQRSVQQYYNRYLNEWDNWVRIVVQVPIKITAVSFIMEDKDV